MRVSIRRVLEPAQWERVQGLIAHRTEIAGGSLWNEHLALLNRLLYCGCWAIWKSRRRYRFTNSTRRFLERPSSVSLDATGALGPSSKVCSLAATNRLL